MSRFYVNVLKQRTEYIDISGEELFPFSTRYVRFTSAVLLVAALWILIELPTGPNKPIDLFFTYLIRLF